MTGRVGCGSGSGARHVITTFLVICAVGLTACRATISIPKDSVPVDSARIVPWSGSGSTNPPADRIVVAHAGDGWHVFLAWSPQAGAGCLDKHDRTLIVSRLPGRSVDQLRHPCSGTAWDLDGRYISGPSSGPSDQHLIPLGFQENATTIVVDLAQQDAWRAVSSTAPSPRPDGTPGSPPSPAPAPTPPRAPTSTRIR